MRCMGGTGKTGKKASVAFGAAVVKIYPRGDGAWIAAWREDGKRKVSSFSTEERVREFARRKARELDAASGQQWVSPARRERLAAFERLAGGEEECGRLLAMLERCEEVLADVEGLASLEQAARFYVSHGPAAVRRSMTLSQALEVLVAEYKAGRKITENTMRNEWKKFVRGREDVPLLEVTREMLEGYFDEQAWSARTRRNAQTRWATFFRRARDLELWPRERPLPTEAMKRTRKADKVPEVFTVAEGQALLAAVRKTCPRYLSYVLIAGWAGCRPSECTGLRWGDLDPAEGVLHLRSEVVGKTARERWVHLDARLVAALMALRGKAEDETRMCLTRAREEVSLLARKALGMKWPPDVLRHSYITYRLQVNANVYEVAEEAGNSPQVIRANYRRPMPPGMGTAWFDLLEPEVM